MPISLIKVPANIHDSGKRLAFLVVAVCGLLAACSMTTSPLHEMIRNGQEREALQAIAQHKMVNDRDQMGYTPLHIAAIRGDRAIAESLIKNGADLNARDFTGRTPFMLALREGRRDLARYFLSQGATLRTHYTLTNALFDAVTGNDQEMTEYLLQHGFSINTLNRNHTSALHIAAAKGDIGMVDYLIRRGADVSVRDNDGWSALHFAGARQYRNIVQRLLMAGAQPSELSSDALGAFSTGVVYEECAKAAGPQCAAYGQYLRIAADHYAKSARFYGQLATEMQQQIEAQQAKNAFALALGAFAMAIQPGTSMPTASGGTVRLYQPVIVPMGGTAKLASGQADYVAAQQEAQAAEKRCLAMLKSNGGE